MSEASTSESDDFDRFSPPDATSDRESLTNDHAHRVVLDRDAGHRPRTEMTPEHRVQWVRISDLINSGTGHIAGRGIDFEAELARRLRHPAETTQRAVQNRRSSLPPLDAFGRSRTAPATDRLARSR
ncbi:hypothetical protein SAMN04489810_1426 [Microbacterium pygmaeum]|uniref:Uncharacterized protein n=1 Tax=Microbacterium pygmaeum TaxID=370764 RepID=A0A1G7XJ84_9MICO|nr:hypothetical protein SAMN04489810_1426 [Microbacterium pygmaeum]